MNSKETYQAEIEGLLRDYEAALADIKARFPHQEEIGNLEANIELLRNKLKDLKSADTEKWEKLKHEINAYMGDIGQSLREGFAYYK